MRRKGCGEACRDQARTLQQCRKELQGRQVLKIEAELAVGWVWESGGGVGGGDSGSEVRRS